MHQRKMMECRCKFSIFKIIHVERDVAKMNFSFGQGTHWDAYTKDYKTLIYFDSYYNQPLLILNCSELGFNVI